MGRWGTGAITTGEAQRIELSYLLKHGAIKKNCIIEGTIPWNNGSTIGFESHFTNEERYLRLFYYLISNETGEKTNYDFKIQLETIPSNLGRVEVIYFLCPITRIRARILYRCYGSKIWKCRKAYQNRIYYATQQCSKLSYHNIRYWVLEKQIERCLETSKKAIYKGMETKLRKRIMQLRNKQEYHDFLRWIIFPKALQKAFNPDLLKAPQK